MKIDYSKLTKEQIQFHVDELYQPLKDKSQLAWMEKNKLAKDVESQLR